METIKAYHLRDISEKYKKDYIYIPEYDVFVSYLREPNFSTVIDYSNKFHLEIAQAIVDKKETEVKAEVVKETNLDKKTLWKILKNKGKMGFCKEEFDGSTENLIKILAKIK